MHSWESLMNEGIYCFCCMVLVCCSGLVVLSRDDQNHHTGFDSRLRGEKMDLAISQLMHGLSISWLFNLNPSSYTRIFLSDFVCTKCQLSICVLFVSQLWNPSRTFDFDKKMGILKMRHFFHFYFKTTPSTFWLASHKGFRKPPSYLGASPNFNSA